MNKKCDVPVLNTTTIFNCIIILLFGVTAFPSSTTIRESNQVVVSVSTILPNVNVAKARQAWLNYTWRGGGIPAVVLPIDKENDNGLFSRKLLPVFADETVVYDSMREGNPSMNSAEENESAQVQYKLTSLGLWQSEIERDTHLGIVSFSPMVSGTNMTWDVEFKTKQRRNVWQKITELLILEASQNLASYVAPPLRLTTRTQLQTSLTSSEVLDKWLKFIWVQGGGLPLPINPISLDANCYQRIIIPPFLVETILSIKSFSRDYKNSRFIDEELVDDDDSLEENEIYYTVDNPGFLTYQVHSHLGRVRYRQNEELGSVEMVWDVTVRPMKRFEKIIQAFTEAIVTTLAHNFKACVELDEKASVVGIYPPRGRDFGIFKGTEPLMSVRKDCWLGRVLDAHLTDKRGSWEQTVSLFQPWTWGIPEGRQNDVTMEWTKQN